MKCRICESKEHTGFRCPKRQWKPIPKVSKKRLASPQTPKKRKPIAKVGKKAIAFAKTSIEWKLKNPPDFQGYWYCKIGGAPLTDGKQDTAGGLRLNICHDVSRVRDSTLANDLNNLFPGCQKHNKAQGSMTLNEYLSTDYDISCGNY